MKLWRARDFIALTVFIIAFCTATAAGSKPDDTTTRIVSLVPNLTELTFALSAGNQVVGVSDFCRYPVQAATLPSVGGLVNPGLEATLRLRPTVVLLYRSQTDFASRLRQLGIHSELFQVDTLADLYGAIDRLGIVTGETSAAANLAADIKNDLEKVKGERPLTGATANAAVGGVIIVSRDPAGLRGMYQAAPDNFLGELFQIAGGTLAVASGAAVSREKIIRANPSLIIDMSNAGQTAGAAPVSRNAGPWTQLSSVEAVQSNQVYQWADPHAKLLGPSVVHTAREMKRLVDAAK